MSSTKIIRKAVFPVAGFGTRFLPATKAMPKELLPILDKPLIQYAAEEAVRAGIDTLIFVTGRHKRAIEDHFDSNPDLEASLLAKGKHIEADMVKNILPNGVECIFVRQAEQLGLGHAVLCAERAVGDEAFAVLLADDFLIDTGDGAVSDLLSAYETTNKSQLSYIEINGPSISNYGVLIPGDRLGSVNGLFEKPNYKSAPSNMASIGRYILQPDIFDILRGINPGASGEIQLADAIHILAKKGEVEAVKLKGKRFDCGVMSGYVAAIINQFGQDQK
jgi:UTP--glucose-1-phosphate uridylyltransferase